MSESFATPTIALWVTNLSYKLNTIEEWLKLVEQQLVQAKQKNADLFIMPEYISAAWLQFADALEPTQEIAWMAQQGAMVHASLKSLADQYQINIVSGTWPVACDSSHTTFFNRSHLFLSDGRTLCYDKVCLTPDEKDPKGWQLKTGNHVSIIEWQGYRLAIIICLDSELPGLSMRLSDQNIDLLLIPSMTGTIAGYSRVFSCAKARAIEQFSCVCVVGCNGTKDAPFDCVGGAGVYIPCENGLNLHGVLGELNNAKASINGDVLTDPGQMLVVENIPLKQIKEYRQQRKVDVWPGFWDPSAIKIINNESHNE